MVTLLGGCAEGVLSSDANVETMEQMVPSDPLGQRCVLPVPELAGAPLEPFRDEDELARYVEASTARCPLASRRGVVAQLDRQVRQAAMPDEGKPGLASAAASKQIAQASASAAAEILILSQGGWLQAVDVSTAGAPRQVGATGNGLLGHATPSPGPLRRGEVFYTFDEIALPVASQAPAPGPNAGAPMPRLRPTVLEITSYTVRDDGLTTLGRTYFESGAGYGNGRSDLVAHVIDGELVLYLSIAPSGVSMVQHAAGYEHERLALPRRLRRDASTQQLQPMGPLLSATDVVRPLPLVDDQTSGSRALSFNTLVRCKPAAEGELACSAKAHLGPHGTHLLTTDTHTYTEAYGRVYAWNIAEGTVVTHRIEGDPPYQTPVVEHGGALHIPVMSGQFSATLRPRLAMASLPLSAFDKQGAQRVSPRLLLESNGPSGRIVHHAFVGSTYAASLDSFSGDRSAGRTLLLFDLNSGADPHVVHGDRDYLLFAPLGPERALFVAQPIKLPAARDVIAEVWTLGPSPVARSARVFAEMSPGELQFAYRPRADGSGLLGLSLRTTLENHFITGEPRLGIFDVTRDHALSLLGFVPASDGAPPCDRDEMDCVGWVMPLFLGDRTFAIVGSIVQELTVDATVQRLGAPVRLEPLWAP